MTCVIRIRAHATPDAASDLHVHRHPPEWARFNLARRICQLPSKEARLNFVANLRLVEAPEFMIALDAEVRRQWPLRKEPLEIPAALVEIMMHTEWRTNGNA